MTSKNKSITRRNVLPTRIIISCALTAIAGIVSIIILLVQIDSISAQYKKMIYDDYTNIKYMNDISNNLHLHQAYMYKYISTNDPSKCEEIQRLADDLKTRINNDLVSFGYNVKGTPYEAYYHDIYSDTTGYFYDINQVFSFYTSGDYNTARYYIDHAMETCVVSVNESIDNLNTITQEDMENAQSMLYIRLNLSRMVSIISVFTIILFAVFCILTSARTADEMVSVDSLTEIYNYDKLLRYSGKMERRGRLQEYTVISLNIKDFKYINLQNGSSIGDDILKGFAAFLYPLIGRHEILARSGGDNFILLVKSPNADKIVSQLNDIKLDVKTSSATKTIEIKIRCGIYDITYGDDISSALNNVSIALNKARLSPTKNIVYFSETMVDEIVEEKDILNSFDKAIENEEFQVYYQPKVDMPTGKLCGAEALVRWFRDGQIVPPFKFIPILENDGAITILDKYVFKHVCQDIAKWEKEGINTVKISSNFSKVHLKNKAFAEDILNIIDEYKVNPSKVEVELTESSGYEDFSALQRFISKMKAAKISISIDDFGTGYSSLSLIQDLDVDVIKLDKSFIDPIDNTNSNDDKTRKMVKHIVHLVNDLNRSVICEGVETDVQANFLVNTGCLTAQGYLYNKPLTKDEFTDRLKNPQYDLIIK